MESILQPDLTCIRFLSWHNEVVLHFQSIMGRVGNFLRKLLPMLHEHFLKQKQNPLLALAYLRNMSSRKSLSSGKSLYRIDFQEWQLWTRSAITCAMANVVCALCFGKRYDHSDEEFLRIVKNIWWLTQSLQCCESYWFHTMFLIPSFANYKCSLRVLSCPESGIYSLLFITITIYYYSLYLFSFRHVYCSTCTRSSYNIW